MAKSKHHTKAADVDEAPAGNAMLIVYKGESSKEIFDTEQQRKAAEAKGWSTKAPNKTKAETAPGQEPPADDELEDVGDDD